MLILAVCDLDLWSNIPKLKLLRLYFILYIYIY